MISGQRRGKKKFPRPREKEKVPSCGKFQEKKATLRSDSGKKGNSGGEEKKGGELEGGEKAPPLRKGNQSNGAEGKEDHQKRQGGGGQLIRQLSAIGLIAEKKTLDLTTWVIGGRGGKVPKRDQLIKR